MNDFPYKKYDMDLDDVIQRIDNIKNNIPQSSSQPYRPVGIQQKLGLIKGTYDGKYIKIITPDDAYDKVNVLTDYFNEPSRMKCSFNYYLEPIVYYHTFKDKILRELENEKKDPTPVNIREYIYLHIKECNLFKVTTAVFIYDMFQAKHILDFSSGWGDRLLAACALKKKYFGIDPNVDNHAGYQHIIKTAGDPSMQTVYPSGAEYLPYEIIDKRVQEHGKFDLIFTSPPYFDYEIYSNKLQSISSYMTSSEYWLVYFIFVVIIKYLPYLTVGGTFGLYIQDIHNRFIVCEPIVLFILSFYSNLEFSGVISENLPTILFKKKSDDVSVSKDMEEKFKKTYPNVYRLTHRLIKRQLYDSYRIETYLIKDKNITLHDNVENNIYYRTFFKLFVQDDIHKTIISYGSRSDTLIYYLAKACHVLDKKCVFYCPKHDLNESPLSSQIMHAKQKYGLHVIEIDVPIIKKQIPYIRSIIKTDIHDLLMEFTNVDPQLKNIMIETILETVSILGIDTNFSGTIFLTVKFPVLIECLYAVFKKAKFYVDQENNNDYTKSFELDRTIVGDKNKPGENDIRWIDGI